MENDEKCSNDTKNYLNNKPLFVMKIFTDRKILFEKIIHSVNYFFIYYFFIYSFIIYFKYLL